MDPELHEMLIGAGTDAIGAFHAAIEESIYSSWIDVATEPLGYKKHFASAKGNGFTKFDGEVDATELVHRSYQIIAQKYTQAVKIPKLEWKQLLAWLGNNFSDELSEVMADAGAAMDESITALIKSAIDPTASNPNLFHDSKFFGTYDLPSSGALAPGQMKNLVKVKTRDAAGLREGFRKGKSLISTMKRPNGKAYHRGGVYRQGFELMFSTADEALIDEVFDTNMTTSRDNKDKIMNVDVQENNLWEAEGMDLILMRPKMGRSMSGFQVVKTEDAPVETNNLPRTAPNGFEEASVQALQAYRSTAVLHMETGFGNPYDLVALLLPKR